MPVLRPKWRRQASLSPVDHTVTFAAHSCNETFETLMIARPSSAFWRGGNGEVRPRLCENAAGRIFGASTCPRTAEFRNVAQALFALAGPVGTTLRVKSQRPRFHTASTEAVEKREARKIRRNPMPPIGATRSVHCTTEAEHLAPSKIVLWTSLSPAFFHSLDP